jgi:2-polyprenyl-3-methyl-5-hydroxy-6-metoxy-1,4-benzoquinol methylase
MARTYSASRVVFNRSIANDVNMRVFEALACGSLLMTNDLGDNGQAEFFQDGVHLATYRDPEELLDKTAFYLSRDAVRERIAAAGREEALGRHTYRHRMTRLLQTVEKALEERATFAPVVLSSEKVSPVEQACPSQVPSIPISLVPLNEAGEGNGAGPTTPYDPAYFEFSRPEILSLIPASARRVLDIGCGAGRLGQALKARQPAEVVGIELSEAAAREARNCLDQVLVGDVERLELPFAPVSFDAIVCGDVLEHLREPERLLQRARSWLRPQGCLIASIPNVRHHSVVHALLDGNWTYESAGLLDRTHLAFFTRRDIEQLFQQAGFTITQLALVPGPGYEEWQAQGRPGAVQVGRLNIGGLPPEEAEEFFAYQYLVTAMPDRDDAPAPEDTTTTLAPRPRTPNPVAHGAPQRGEGGRAPLAPECGGDEGRRSVPLTERRATPVTGRRQLRILFLGDFGSSWRHEAQTANALLEQGHAVTRLHEYLMPSVEHVLGELNSGRYDCLLFYKGRIAARSVSEVFHTTGEAIAEVIRRANVPCYTWYVDRALGFDLQPSREQWMRRVAPLCRVAFVADGALAQTDWARWHVLREPIDAAAVQRLHVPDAERQPLAFIGQIYGSRDQELAAVSAAFPLHLISGVYGSALSPVLQSYQVILGPRYPTVPGFWGNRVYVVLGHDGFFLAPEVEGMRAEGILPGVHYAPLGDDPVADVRRWLARPRERQRIARAGQDLVLGRFTYAHAVQELCRVIEETL